jgi:acetyl-CoA carboxylase carboxyl transferase subunit alpha
MASQWSPLEGPLIEIEERIAELERLTERRGIDKSAEIAALRRRHAELTERIFSNLTPWDRTLMARHPRRPYTLDYLSLMFSEFIELHGDRRFGDDPAMVAGLARLDGRTVAVVGHQKGRDIKERQFRNFGSARPEGYRKAGRIMRMAEKFGFPVISLVDTPAAECRVEAEERGICESIASSMMLMSQLAVPIVVVIIGEGGSGGAIALAVGDWIAMLEYSIYSVIPPEGCAAILSTFGRDASRAPEAAQALRLTADSTFELGVVDEVIEEPVGGAHRDPAATAQRIKSSVLRSLEGLSHLSPAELIDRRYRKFRRMGQLSEPASGE